MADDPHTWEGVTLHGLFQQAAAQHPHATAAVFDNGRDTTVTTYSELAQGVEDLCSVLRSIVPDIPGQSVGLYAKTAGSLPLWVLSILQLPACLVPMDPDSPLQLDNIRVPYILVQLEQMQGFLQKWSHLEVCTVSSRSLLQHGLFLVRVATNPTQSMTPLAYRLQTSGTTGQPKTVGVPHSCIVPNILHLRSLFEVTTHDVIFSASPLTFDPCIVELFLALSSGAALLMVPEEVKKAPRFLADVLVRRQQVTVLQATPSLVRMFGAKLLQTQILHGDSPLRLLAFGGEECPVPADICAWRGPGNTTRVYNIYGITEVSSWATLYRIPEEHISTGNSSSVPLGQPLLGTKLEVRNREGKPVSGGQGVLYIGGDRRQCYLDGEDVTPPSDVVMRSSGDVVDLHGDELIFRGRLYDQVKRNGKRLDLRWIEQTGCKLDGVETCVAVMDRRDRLLLFVVLSAVSTRGQGRAEDIMLSLRSELPTHAVPDKVIEVAELPVTRHGKVDKEALLLSSQSVSPLTVDHSTDVYQYVCELWGQAGGTLMTETEFEENQTQSFLASGGNSLTAVQLVENLQSAFGHTFPDALDIILHQTLGDLVKYAQSVIEGKNDVQTNRSSSPNLVIPQQHILHKGHSNSAKTLESKASQEKRPGIRHPGDQKRKKIKISEDSVVRPFHKRTQVSQDVPRSNNCAQAVMRGSQTVCLQSNTEENGQVNCLVPDVLSTSAALEDVSCLATELTAMEITMETVWTCDTGKCVDASPLLLTEVSWYPAGVVFIGSHSHKFCAIAMDTGELLWETELGDRVESSACCSVDVELIIVGCYDNCVYVLETRTGTIKWRYHTGGAVKSSPCLDTESSLVFVGSHDQHVHALDVKKRCCVWKTHCGGGSVFSSPCLSSSPRLLCVGTLTGKLIAINPDTGAVLWHTALPKPIFSSPRIMPRQIYVGCVDGELYCVDHHGNITWSFTTAGPIFSSPCLSSSSLSNDLLERPPVLDMIVVGSHDHHVHCLSEQGQLRWKFETDSAVYATPFVFNLRAGSDTVVDSNVLDRMSQSERLVSSVSTAKVRTNTDTSNSDRRSEGHRCVAVASTKGTLYILTLGTGSCLSSLRLPGEVFSSPVVWNNLLVVGCRDDFVYGVKVMGYADVKGQRLPIL